MSIDRNRAPPVDVRVRGAVATDLAALVALEYRVFASERIAERQWRRYLAGSSVEVLVASRSNAVIGAAVVFFRAKSTVARLYSIAVADEARQAGVGALLLTAAERLARRRGASRIALEVRSDNIGAQRLYERYGYQCFAVKHGYYEDGHDAQRYRKDLSGGRGG
ncbi:MAG: GNAT family N-acetyltransferase [Rhodanobacteraceae bacterium]